MTEPKQMPFFQPGVAAAVTEGLTRANPLHPKRVHVTIEGTSHSGKTTIGRMLYDALQARHIAVVFNDPDVRVQRTPQEQEMAVRAVQEQVALGTTQITIDEGRERTVAVKQLMEQHDRMRNAIDAFLRRVGVVPEVAKALTIHQALEYLNSCGHPEDKGEAGWFLPMSAINHLQHESLTKVTQRAHHAHHCDLDVRINGQNEHYEADWIKQLRPIRLKPDEGGMPF